MLTLRGKWRFTVFRERNVSEYAKLIGRFRTLKTQRRSDQISSYSICRGRRQVSNLSSQGRAHDERKS
jgi:hypothetical protein